MSSLIDTHFHLDCCKNHRQLYEQINMNKQYTLCVTNTPEAFERCIKTYPETKYIKFALGYNPQVIMEIKFNSFLFMKYLNRTRYIGEVGLDFSKDLIKYKEEQIKVFDFICKIAAKNNKILTVHSRNAEKEVLEIMTRNKVKRAILHWYTGEIELVDRFIEAGYFFSFNERMLNGERGKQLLQNLPITSVLIESDFPYGQLTKEYEIHTTYNKVSIKIDREQVKGNYKKLLYIS